MAGSTSEYRNKADLNSGAVVELVGQLQQAKLELQSTTGAKRAKLEASIKSLEKNIKFYRVRSLKNINNATQKRAWRR